MKRPLIILTGPTAVGKTTLSILLAKEINGEIISADSMQVYKDMNIGTAKILENEMGGIKHYLIDLLSAEEEFNVVKFQTFAKQAMEEIYAKGKIPIIVGGTGFYIQSLVYDIHFDENEKDLMIRKRLEKDADEFGAAILHERLKEVDPKAASEIHENNIKKVIRALEYFYQTGKQISSHNEEERKKESPYNFCYFVLNLPREILYERINKRIDNMLIKGLLQEVETLKEKGFDTDLVSMQGLGYKEILSYLDGSISLEDAIYILKRDTRHFAKRQITWFKREKEVIWLDKENYQSEEELLSYIYMLLKQQQIIKQ